MKHLFENVFKATINRLIYYEDNSKKIEYNFHGPVNFIGKHSSKRRIESSSPKAIVKKSKVV